MEIGLENGKSGRSMKNSGARRMTKQDSKVLTKVPDVGLVLMDMSLKPIASDRGAFALLNGMNSGSKTGSASLLPKEVMDLIGETPSDLSSAKMTFHVGASDYTIRAYRMEAEAGFPPMIALHIEKVSSTIDAVAAVAGKYHLTDREEETLRGIAQGLSSKELAEKMNISPNTVKVFLRLIMIKMGVTNRGAIVAQILQSQSAPTERDDRASTAKA
jgi:DNA-binding CsgD family transcriptional regulator